jgi:CheY-like chemotaxis protein
MLRESLKAFLQQQGFLVITAKDGAEALEAAPLFPFSVILTDIQMPGMDGFEAVRRIRALGGWPSVVPIIALSGLTPQPSREECNAIGLNAFVAKGCALEGLARIIVRLIAEHPVNRSSAARE